MPPPLFVALSLLMLSGELPAFLPWPIPAVANSKRGRSLPAGG